MTMWYRAKRVRLLVAFAAAILFGVVLEAAMDPFEGTGIAAIGLLAGMVGMGAVGGYWYWREIRTVPDADERQRSIERRASRLAHGALLLGVTGLGTVLATPLYTGPVWPLLLGLVGLNIAVHELSIEYYRRQM
ncbi:hypothetical protein Huta_0757 [Halorhabdus utahensis DSM 12940]|uniref:DUF2178 domain-containing protein n=1 Tax=Halorhabdus utahensis (strain DSM 12940 / JCM 11049 / AX-2) TaxID=519442 RepID=C7NTV3_HALUD|nr:hypothetical protein [Halorhabdus utahensis]ACV10942.1 hypothetical protein Huta_0757 [Halorhabdus utahensis DSM 12940]